MLVYNELGQIDLLASKQATHEERIGHSEIARLQDEIAQARQEQEIAWSAWMEVQSDPDYQRLYTAQVIAAEVATAAWKAADRYYKEYSESPQHEAQLDGWRRYLEAKARRVALEAQAEALAQLPASDDDIPF